MRKIKADHRNDRRRRQKHNKMSHRPGSCNGPKENVSGSCEEDGKQQRNQDNERVLASGKHAVDKEPKQAKKAANYVKWSKRHTSAKLQKNFD